MLIRAAQFKTGSAKGYIKVKNQYKESEMQPVPDDVKGLRGNYRKAMEMFIARGCTMYTTYCAQYNGSNRYYYTVYTGYKEE